MAARDSGRDPYYDNAKILLVTLVVVGHSWTLLPSTGTQRWLYDFLYAWHVPAFVLVTGYLSRNFSWTGPRLWSLVKTVAVPYVIFEGALALFRHDVGGIHFERLWLNPHWPMWYLSALFFWRLATPIIRRIPAPVSIAVALSLAGGFWAGDTFDAARMFGLLPFFVLGVRMRPAHWDLVREPRFRAVAVWTFVTLFALARFMQNWIPGEWLYYRSRYDTFDISDTSALMVRMILLVVGAAGALSFFALVPRERSWLSTLGPATMVVYLFHGFAVTTPRYEGFLPWAQSHFAGALALTTVGAVGLAWALAAPPVASRLAPFTDPIGALEGRVRALRARRQSELADGPQTTGTEARGAGTRAEALSGDRA